MWSGREALLLPEVVARKCLVKNAMTEVRASLSLFVCLTSLLAHCLETHMSTYISSESSGVPACLSSLAPLCLCYCVYTACVCACCVCVCASCVYYYCLA